MRKTFRYRLYVKKSQATTLDRWLYLTRWVYNKTLEVRKEAWEKREESISKYDTNKLLTTWKVEKPELREVYSQVLQNAQARVDLGLKAFFSRVKRGETPGYPRFRGRNRYSSLCWPQSPKGAVLEDNALVVSGVGSIKLNLHRPLEGRVKTTTVTRTATGKWFVSFSCDDVPQIEAPEPMVPFLGLDLGLSAYATAHDGSVLKPPKFYRVDSKDLARAQRKLSKLKRLGRGQRPGPKRLKRRHTVARIHERIKNRRLAWAHQVSRRIVNGCAVICVEDLNIAGMLHNHCLAKSISDAAWGLFLTLLEVKAEEAGRQVVRVDPRGTSQRCSRCGSVVKKDLGVRTHVCPVCGLVMDRDRNAAVNILRLGLTTLGLPIPRRYRLLFSKQIKETRAVVSGTLRGSEKTHRKVG